MHKFKTLIPILGLAALSACASGPDRLAMPDGSNRMPINQFSSESEVVRVDYGPALALAKKSPPMPAADVAPSVAPGGGAVASPLVGAKPSPADLAATADGQKASAPAAAASAPAPEPVATKPVPEIWKVEATDVTLSRTLKRWAEKSGMPVVWDAEQDKPALAGQYEGTFEEAVEKLMIDSKYSRYKVHACAFDNVIRILHESQLCRN